MSCRRVAGLPGVLVLLAAGLVPAGCEVEEGPYGQELFGIRYLEREEAEFLRLINIYRTENDLGTLTSSTTINQAAYDFSVDMGERAFFAHEDPEGRTPFDRMCAATYVPACEGSTAMGENIAAGMESAAEAFEGWRLSPGHNANMLTPDYVAIGIGRAYVEGSPYGWYWTTDFGGILDEDGCGCALADAEECATASCGGGVRECDDHCQWNECHVPAAGTEICDGYDNDCDGTTDEDVCGSCVPTAEICDDRDNDCDTVVDENRACGPECEPILDAEECNGNDDDCDGIIDDGCPCPDGTPARQCGVAAGRCTLGEQSCVDGTWGTCTGAVLPRRDLCDGEDNDCDGSTDENACNVDEAGDDGCGCVVVRPARSRSEAAFLGLLVAVLVVGRRRARKGGR
jgi:hypothetical protein